MDRHITSSIESNLQLTHQSQQSPGMINLSSIQMELQQHLASVESHFRRFYNIPSTIEDIHQTFNTINTSNIENETIPKYSNTNIEACVNVVNCQQNIDFKSKPPDCHLNWNAPLHKIITSLDHNQTQNARNWVLHCLQIHADELLKGTTTHPMNELFLALTKKFTPNKISQHCNFFVESHPSRLFFDYKHHPPDRTPFLGINFSFLKDCEGKYASFIVHIILLSEAPGSYVNYSMNLSTIFVINTFAYSNTYATITSPRRIDHTYCQQRTRPLIVISQITEPTKTKNVQTPLHTTTIKRRCIIYIYLPFESTDEMIPNLKCPPANAKLRRINNKLKIIKIPYGSTQHMHLNSKTKP